MITRLIKTEQEYLNLIADAIEFGVHRPNQFATPDEDGMSVCDSFEHLPVECLYEYLGAYPSDLEIPYKIDDDGTSYSHIDEWDKAYRNTLQLYPDNDYTKTPGPKDYPIIVYWRWADDFDRFGTITERFFMWWSLAEISSSQFSIKDVKNKWLDKFQEKIESWKRLENK